jgi:hypothetical protein
MFDERNGTLARRVMADHYVRSSRRLR